MARGGATTPAKPPAKPAVSGPVSPVLWYLLLAVAVLALLLGLPLAAKAARRRHRRRRGPPAARAAAAWRELLDLGRDLGIERPGNATRREQAAHAESSGLPRAAPVAAAADAATFGAEAPDAATAQAVWALADEARRATRSALPPVRRVWVALNPASLF